MVFPQNILIEHIHHEKTMHYCCIIVLLFELIRDFLYYVLTCTAYSLRHFKNEIFVAPIMRFPHANFVNLALFICPPPSPPAPSKQRYCVFLCTKYANDITRKNTPFSSYCACLGLKRCPWRPRQTVYMHGQNSSPPPGLHSFVYRVTILPG